MCKLSLYSFTDLFRFEVCECLSGISCVYISGDAGSETVPYTPSAHFVWLTNAE